MPGLLQEVAADLYDRYGDDISSLSVLFPSRRARLFFIDALSGIAERPLWQPRWTTIDELMSEYGFEAVFIGSGAGLPMFMHIPGENLCGVYSANEFLTRINLMKAYKEDSRTPIMKSKSVAVVGGGNSALEEALYLTNFAKNVTIIHRRDAFRADKTMQERVAQNHKINVIWNCVVEEILGTESPLGVTGLRLKNVKTDNTTDVAVDGVFIAIGHHPNTDLVKGHLHLDKENYIVTKHNSCETSIKGVFAAGDVRDPQYRQAIIAAGSGCVAALEAEKYLNELGGQKNAVKPEAV